jgi:hypothetical protein
MGRSKSFFDYLNQKMETLEEILRHPSFASNGHRGGAW